jgi:hypothetical protein
VGDEHASSGPKRECARKIMSCPGNGA